MWIAALAIGLGAVAAHANPGADGPPWLGIGIGAGMHGVRVHEVIRDTPADEAGLRPLDEIVAIADDAVVTPADLKAVIGRFEVGDPVELSVWREGRVVDVSAVLGPRLNADEILSRRLLGEPAPALDIEVVYGAGVGSSPQLFGRVAVLQFFTLGCKPCLDQHSALSRLVDEHADDGLVALALSGDRDGAVEHWAARSAPSFDVAIDPYGVAFRAFHIDRELPALVVIDRSGVVAYAGLGGQDNLDRAIAAARHAVRRARRR